MPKQESKKNFEVTTEEKVKQRVQIESVQPKISSGRFPVKRIVEDTVKVEADIFVDGSNELSALLLYKKDGKPKWSELPMKLSDNDRWQAEFKVTEIGLWKFNIEAWIDHFRTWQRDFKKRVEAEQDAAVDLLIGLELINAVLRRAAPKDKEKLSKIIEKLNNKRNKAEANKAALSEDLTKLMARYPDRSNSVFYREMNIAVEPKIARFGAWYEMFPRSAGPVPGRHGTFKDVIARLPYISEMGFSVLYLPPIHPIGTTFRKGRNNATLPEKGAVGSPWAIGSKEGGHYSIHPQLGTLEDFKELLSEAAEFDISVALDIAIQCSPDHPYVKEHPEWFRKRPDGTIQYAENPPKKYQDIYPMDFETENWRGLWEELRNVFVYWIKQGVKIFRVDNPHTKDLSFWEWVLKEIKKDYPDVVFLAEAFTRPKLLYRLAKLGFTQSYNYFPWRNTKEELTQFITEITRTELKEFLRANLWINTPDILTEYLQVGGKSAFKIRLVLAATMGASYGIYGPAFELCVDKPLAPKSEEYLDSEKYEIKQWKTDSPESIAPMIAKINRIRNENAVLQHDHNIEFYNIDNDNLICYGKHSGDYSEIVLVVVNLDTYWAQSGWLELPLDKFGIPDKKPYQVHDLLSGERYLWTGPRNFIKLDPKEKCAHIFKIRRFQRTEKNFDYYL